MKAVGIGCYWFAKRNAGSATSEFSAIEHVEHIREALEGVENLSNIEIDIQTDDYTGPPVPISSDHNQNFFPIFLSGTINFDIYIPSRIQEKYAFELSIGHGIENFHVLIEHQYDSPVSFVSFDVPAELNEKSNLSPSFAVAFVRELLREKLRNDPNIEFQCLGPSPMHTDIFVRPTGVEKPSAVDISNPGDGYRQLVIGTPGGGDTDAMAEFVGHYKTALSIYYSVIIFRNDLQNLRTDMVERTRSLLAAEISHERFAFKKYRKMGSAIDEGFRLILEEKIGRMYLDNHLTERRQSGYLPPDNCFTSFVENEVNEIVVAPSDDIKDVLKTFEERRQRYWGNFSTLVSSLAGGIFGALLGAVLSFYLGFYSANHITNSAQVTASSLVQQGNPAPQK